MVEGRHGTGKFPLIKAEVRLMHRTELWPSGLPLFSHRKWSDQYKLLLVVGCLSCYLKCTVPTQRSHSGRNEERDRYLSKPTKELYVAQHDFVSEGVSIYPRIQRMINDSAPWQSPTGARRSKS